MKGKFIYHIADEQTYEDGQIIFREDTPGDWVYVVLSGEVEMYKSIEGHQHVIGRLQPGDVFGEVGFLGRIRRTATARAVGETTVGIIDREFLLKEYNQLSGMFRSILETMSRRFAYNLDRLSYLDVKGKPKPIRVVNLTCRDRMEFARAYTTSGENEGLFIRTENPLHSGEPFVLKLKLPGASDPL
jgi:CRP-like cAMP-binding protein